MFRRKSIVSLGLRFKLKLHGFVHARSMGACGTIKVAVLYLACLYGFFTAKQLRKKGSKGKCKAAELQGSCLLAGVGRTSRNAVEMAGCVPGDLDWAYALCKDCM